MSAKLASLGQQILNGVKTSLGDAWEKQLSENDKQLIAACAMDAATLQLAAIAATNAEALVQVGQEQMQINAQLANVTSIGADVARSAFWTSFNTIASRGGEALGVLAKALIVAAV